MTTDLNQSRLDRFDTKIVPLPKRSPAQQRKPIFSDNAAEWIRQIIAGLCAAFLIVCMWAALDFWEKSQDRAHHAVPVACSHESGGC